MAVAKRKPKGTVGKMTFTEAFGGTPRPWQEPVLELLEQDWAAADVWCIALPVAWGKRYLMNAIMRREAKAKVKSVGLNPTNILNEQFLETFPKVHTLRGMGTYSCERYADQPEEHRLSCKEARACSKEKKFCSNCPYTAAVRKAHAMPYGIYNYHTYLAHKLFAHTLIVDEAHNLLPMIQGMAGRVLWHFQYGFPSSIQSYGQLLRWVEKHPKLKTDAKLGALQKELISGRVRYLVQKGTDWYHGREEECLKLLPIDVSDQPPLLWPSKVKKIVLMSATIGRKDVEELGLSKRRVRFISAASPIPADRRPVIAKTAYNMSFAAQDVSLPLVAADIRKLLASNPEKGFVHAPYAVAEKLRELLGGEPRLMFHNRDNKRAQYQAFRDSNPSDGKVLVASGLYEGVDLLEDMGRWQVIAKVPWPSLAEPAIAYRAEHDREWYSWEAIKVVQQAVGRICRSPTDFGKTIILDNSFKRLFDDNQELFPQWWIDSLSFVEAL
jgi:Rad3-related DNA helicase